MDTAYVEGVLVYNIMQTLQYKITFCRFFFLTNYFIDFKLFDCNSINKCHTSTQYLISTKRIYSVYINTHINIHIEICTCKNIFCASSKLCISNRFCLCIESNWAGIFSVAFLGLTSKYFILYG